MRHSINRVVITSALLLVSTNALAADAAPAATTSAPAAGITSTSVTSTKAAKRDKSALPPAPPCHQPKLLHEGFYIGGQVGYDTYRFRISTQLLFPPAVPTPGVNTLGNPVMGANGVAGGLFVGYGTYWVNYYYTGAEVFINASSAIQPQNFYQNNGDGTTMGDFTKVSTNNMSWGISFIPGVKYSDSSLLYIRLGYSRAKLKGLNTVTATDAVAGGAAYYSADKHQWAGGMSYGVGIETALYKRVSLRTEFNHYGYNTFSDPLTTNYGPSNNQLMVSLIYHFV